MIAPARRVALSALLAIGTGEELPDALVRTRERLPDDRDRGLAAAIVIGTLRWRARLDHHLAGASSRPLARLDPAVLEILRLSLFQLLFLERVPASAVVDDAVSMARKAGKSSAGGFVNAVLRTLSRSRAALTLPQPPPAVVTPEDRARAIEALHVSGSHPAWLVARWVDRLGLDAAGAWIDFDNTEPPLTLRANRRRHSREVLAERLREHGVESTPTRFAPDGLIVGAGNPLRTGLAGSGDFHVQDEASQLVPLLVAARRGDRVLDACAAPGGKTLVLADDLAGEGALVAADVRMNRIRVLKAVLEPHGAAAAIVMHDVARGLPFGEVFDRVLLDAPCTGLGTLRRDVDIRWRRQEDDIAAAAARQHRMIAAAASVVRPGGRLVYATCSSEPEENEQIVDRFLADTPAFRRVGRDTLIEEVPALAPLLEPMTGDLQTRPDRHGLEVFYASALERV